MGFDEARVQEGDFVVTLTGADGKEIVKQAVQDPLHPVMEVYDIKEIKRFKASLQRAEFSLRFPYSENVRYVKIEKRKARIKNYCLPKNYNYENNNSISIHKHTLLFADL
ncbi:hypothetical protein OWR28_16640 [Chryseobacterium sp. 1B4]